MGKNIPDKSGQLTQTGHDSKQAFLERWNFKKQRQNPAHQKPGPGPRAGKQHSLAFDQFDDCGAFFVARIGIILKLTVNQSVGQVTGVFDPNIHAPPAQWGMDVGGVAGEKNPPDLIFFDLAVTDPKIRLPDYFPYPGALGDHINNPRFVAGQPVKAAFD